MARIVGVDLPREKRVEVGLTYIFGIGLSTAQKILAETGISPDTRVKDLDEQDVNKLRDYIEHNVKVEGDLRREVSLNIKRLWKSAAIAGPVIVVACRFAAREPKPTRVPARVPSALLPVRRKPQKRNCTIVTAAWRDEQNGT